jgi:CubicO group peptidase (beta-lactamase class C family)
LLTETAKDKDKDPAAIGSYSWAGAFGTFFWVDPRNGLIGIFMSQMWPPDFTLGQDFKRLTYEAMTEAK